MSPSYTMNSGVSFLSCRWQYQAAPRTQLGSRSFVEHQHHASFVWLYSRDSVNYMFCYGTAMSRRTPQLVAIHLIRPSRALRRPPPLSKRHTRRVQHKDGLGEGPAWVENRQRDLSLVLPQTWPRRAKSTRKTVAESFPSETDSGVISPHVHR
jgi:hypothetical protein